jgi:hypothetical protein
MTNVTAEGEGTFRAERLRGVEAELGREICRKLSTLYDHNGVLFVDWAERPSTQEIATVIEVWGRHEDKPITYHYELGVELVTAAARFNPFEASDYTRRAAIEHLRTARDLLKKAARLMKKNGSRPQSVKRLFQSLKLAESALRHARRCNTIDLKEVI